MRGTCATLFKKDGRDVLTAKLSDITATMDAWRLLFTNTCTLAGLLAEGLTQSVYGSVIAYSFAAATTHDGGLSLSYFFTSSAAW